MGIKQGAGYALSFWARRGPGSVSGLTATVTGAWGKVLAQAPVTGLTDQWQQYTVVLRATDTEAKAHLKLALTGEGTVDLDGISLFSKDTWGSRPNGLRTNLVQLLKDIQPDFCSFRGLHRGGPHAGRTLPMEGNLLAT